MSEKYLKVVETARLMFSELGYKKVTMDDLAKKSGVTKKTIYTYFKDKDDLIKYFVLEKINEIKDMIYDIQKLDLPVDKKMHKIIYVVLNYQYDEKIINKLTYEAMDMPLGVAKKWADFIYEKVIYEIKLFLDDAAKNGFIKDYNTDLLANMFYRIYFSIIFENRDKITNKDIDDMIDILNYGLFRGDINE